MCAADKEAGAQKKDSSQDAEAEAAKLQEGGVGGSKPSKDSMYQVEGLLGISNNIQVKGACISDANESVSKAHRASHGGMRELVKWLHADALDQNDEEHFTQAKELQEPDVVVRGERFKVRRFSPHLFLHNHAK